MLTEGFELAGVVAVVDREKQEPRSTIEGAEEGVGHRDRQVRLRGQAKEHRRDARREPGKDRPEFIQG